MACRRVLAKKVVNKKMRAWFKAYSGKDVVRDYRKHYHASWSCAILELKMLGVAFPPEDLELAKQKQVGAKISTEARARKKAEKKGADAEWNRMLKLANDPAYELVYSGYDDSFTLRVRTPEEREQAEREALQELQDRLQMSFSFSDSDEFDPFAEADDDVPNYDPFAEDDGDPNYDPFADE